MGFDKLRENFVDQVDPRDHFKHVWDEFNFRDDVYNVDTEYEDGRRYIIPATDDMPECVYPSTTTILTWIAESKGEHEWLHAWREYLGEIEANRQSQLATIRGTAMHEMAEHYLRNEPVINAHPRAWRLFQQIKPHLNQVNNIMCLEHALYSHKLKIAGRVDCVGDLDDFYQIGSASEFDGVEHIIDFKSSKRVKTFSEIGGYMRQLTIYSMMLHEMTGIRIELGRIIMGVDKADEASVFDVIIGDFRKTVIDEVAEIHAARGESIDIQDCYAFFL